MIHYCGSYTPNRTDCPLTNGSLAPLKISYTQFDYISECYFIIVIATFGILGNCLSVTVMMKDKDRHETLFLLQVLAIADSFYLVMLLLRYPPKYFIAINDYYKMQLFVFPLTKTAQTAAVWAMLLVTVDRYIHVSEPLKGSQKFTNKGRRIMAVLVFVFALAYNMPRFFDSCLMTFVDPCTNRKLHSMVYSPTLNKGNIYLDIYVYGAYIVFLYLGPLLSLVVLNVKLIGAIRSSYRMQARNSITCNPWAAHRRKNETNATMILIIIIIIFILCETPELVMKLLTLINRHVDFISVKSTLFNRLTTINTLLLAANSSVNFIVYVVYGKRFRNILCRCIKVYLTCNWLCCQESYVDEPKPYRLQEYKVQEYKVRLVKTKQPPKNSIS